MDETECVQGSIPSAPHVISDPESWLPTLIAKLRLLRIHFTRWLADPVVQKTEKLWSSWKWPAEFQASPDKRPGPTISHLGASCSI